MNILLDAIPLKGLMTGISRYLRNLYTEIERLPGVTVHYSDGRTCTRKMPAQAIPGPWMKTTSLVWKLPHHLAFLFRVTTWLAYEMRIRRLVDAHDFTLYHETAFTPAAVKTIPQILTIYDLSLMRFREMHPKERVRSADFFLKRRLHYASHVIAISEFVRSEICEELHLAPQSVTAVPLAPDPAFYPREEGVARKVMASLGLPQDYALFVGTLEPRKNLPLLMKAAKGCKPPIPIVLAGWEGWGREQLLAEMDDPDLQNRVFTTGYVDEEALACLYSNARFLVFPSLYEGFGLPLLEAMACGCPVICSDAASLPEVAGDAAYFVDPHDAEGLVEAMDRVNTDRGLRDELIQKGLDRAAQFTWKRTAQETLDVFKRVAQCDANEPIGRRW